MLLAKENYSQMSTQELIEIIGFVDEKDKEAFLKELNQRVPKMSQQEYAQYERRLRESPQDSSELNNEE